MRHPRLVFAIGLLLTAAVLPGIAVAVNETTSQQPSEQAPGGENEGSELRGPIREAIISVLMDSVQGLAETLNGMLVRIFVSYPDVKASYVLDIHQKVFRISLALASVAAAWIGILHMVNRVDGVRPILSLLGAVAIGGAAPSLLWYPVELSRLTTKALAPTNAGIVEVTHLSFELFLVLVLDAFLLVGTVMIFIARDVIFMLGVSLSPLIALMAVTPPCRRFADRLVSIWIACLLIGPINVVTLDLTLSLMGSSALEIPHYLWGLGGIALLFGLPVILLGAGAIVFAPMTRVVTHGPGNVWRGSKRVWKQVRETGDDAEGERPQNEYRRSPRRNRFRSREEDDYQ